MFDTFCSSPKLFDIFTEHTKIMWRIDHLTFNDFQFICSGSDDKTVRAWDVDNNKQSFDGHLDNVNSFFLWNMIGGKSTRAQKYFQNKKFIDLLRKTYKIFNSIKSNYLSLEFVSSSKNIKSIHYCINTTFTNLKVHVKVIKNNELSEIVTWSDNTTLKKKGITRQYLKQFLFKTLIVQHHQITVQIFTKLS
ncbi:hypothetical protein RFI_02072 [Reticulomyxa filosa]|uniref:Uncharacterized protein n=1 Tax=Reticulomyxa filosa TaxID=46433 RepID=X6PBF8_RETFI|nr:hypothetical protein RFI_02072 [Reticulomyxa filosa]|eukprot:ETO35002.1 hypothetical protein RFI_02072 [Reticulomyxa filosa]